MASSGGCHALSPRKVYFVEFYMRADVFWLFAFYDLSRSLFKRYNEFQGVILKLNTRLFCCYNICFCNSISSLRILKLVGFLKWLAHPVSKKVVHDQKKSCQIPLFSSKTATESLEFFVFFFKPVCQCLTALLKLPETIRSVNVKSKIPSSPILQKTNEIFNIFLP